MQKNQTLGKEKFSIKKDFTMLALLIIPIAVAVNFVGSNMASTLKLPCYMDAIGTVFSAMIAGPWVGAVTGALTNILTGITNPVNFAFIPVSVVLGLTTGFCARKNLFTVWWKWLIAIFTMSLTSILVAAPIIVTVFGGVTGSGASLIGATLMAAGSNVWATVIGTDGLFTVLDRIIAIVISFAVIKVIPARTLVKFSLGQFYIRDKKSKKDNA